MKIIAWFARIVLILNCSGALAAGITSDVWWSLSSEQRTVHFERYYKRSSSSVSFGPASRQGFIKNWLATQAPLYAKYDAKHIDDELFDVYLRRQGQFPEVHPFEWLAERLRPLLAAPVTADHSEEVRMYIDAALIFSAGQVPSWWMGTPGLVVFDWLRYRWWNNPIMKNFINDFADGVAQAPKSPVERARWFFAAYRTCGPEFTN